MKNQRLAHGSTLALTVALVGVLLLSITVFVLYYIQTFGAHKETQTAIDAAALQAAKDVGEIYIDSNEGSLLGPVGVSDNLPPGDDLNKRPIVGINTLMATIRLDALIAEELGSTSMLVLAREDYEKARVTSYRLQQKIKRACGGEVVKDRKGNTLDIRANATKVYDTNEVRLANGKRFGGVSISPGLLKPNATLSSTGTPAPQPISLARLSSSQKYDLNGAQFYMAGVEIKDSIAGHDWSFEFVPLSTNSATLIDPALYSEITSSDYLPPTVIKAEVDQEITAMATNLTEEEKKKQKPQRLHSSATALCAFYGKLPSTDGALKVSFPQTKPPQGYNIDFTSVQSIMTGKDNQISLKKTTPDASFQTVQTAKDLGTDSKYAGAGGSKGWNDEDHGIWVKAIGGAFPDEPGSSISNPPVHFHSRFEDNPSVVLSFLVYDWLKIMYTKPNISEVVKALKTPLTPAAATAMNIDGLMQPVYAEINTELPVTFALCHVPSNGEGDPRNLKNYPKDPEGYRRQFANVWGYVPADITLPASSLVVSIDNNQVVTTNGQPPGTLTDLYTAVVNMNNISADTMKVAQEVELKQLEEISRTEKFVVDNVDKTTGKPLSSAMVPALLEAAKKHESAVIIYGRALLAMQNAKFGLQMSYALLNDRKMLSSFGATKINDRTFELMPGFLYVPTRAATENELLGSGEKISTGQDPAAGVCDWLAPPSDDEKECLQFFISSKSPAIGQRDSHFDLLAPALAASSIPPKDDHIYSFALDKDGKIPMKHQLGPNAGVNVLEGQHEYQNLASLVTDGKNNVKLKWNCVARNNVTNVEGAYFRNMVAAVTNILPNFSDKPLACEWSIRCPAPEPECKKETIKIGSAQAGIAAASFNLANIQANKDAAGNVRIFFEQGNKKEELKFYESHEEWNAAWHKAWDKSIWSGNINGTNTLSANLKGRLGPAALSQFYRASEGYITGNFAKEIMNNPDKTRGQEYFETFAKGMANLNVNDGYMKLINDKNAAQGITSAELQVIRAMVYTSWVFYSKDDDGCTTLYTFAS